MITVNGIEVKADIFPDKTSQVWHLPEMIMKSRTFVVVWNFEEEREIIDLLALRKLLRGPWMLHVPYFPGARQDKSVSNDTTFNKEVYIDLFKMLRCEKITTFDIHSDILNTSFNLFNMEVVDFHKWVIESFDPHFMVFPDAGARKRYPYLDGFKCITFEFEKARDQATGNLTSHQLSKDVYMPEGRYLMVDDLCDGGATFLSIASQIRARVPDAVIGLAVTHGLFSKGKEIFREQGIQLFYTDTLIPSGNSLADEEHLQHELFKV